MLRHSKLQASMRNVIGTASRRFLSTRTNDTRTAFEISNLELYHKYQKIVTPMQSNQESLNVLIYPGTRVLSMALPHPAEYIQEASTFLSKAILPHEVAQALIDNQSRNIGGNVLSLDVVTKMQGRLDAYVPNLAVTCVVFASKSVDIFSGGLFSDIPAEEGGHKDAAYRYRLIHDKQQAVENDMNGIKNEKVTKDQELQRARKGNDSYRFVPDYLANISTQQIQAIQDLSKQVSNHSKVTIAQYGGVTAGTAYGVFAGSTYKLGTASTSFHIPEIARGLIPIGGLAYHISHCCEYGVAIARYLAVSEHALRANEMYGVHLLSHLVEDAAHDNFAISLAHTINDTLIDGLDNWIVNDAVDDIMETFHCNSDIDVSKSPIWNKMLLVPFDETPLTYHDEATGKDIPYPELLPGGQDLDAPAFDDQDFLAFLPQIQQCFSEDNPAKNIQSLYALKSTWGDSTAKKFELLLRNEAECLDHWYALTRLSKTATIDVIREKELEIMASLGVK